MRSVIITLLVLSLTFNLALALGIQPAKTELVFSNSLLHQELIHEGQLWVVNTEGRVFTVKVYPSGDLAPFIIIKNPEIIFTPETSTQLVEFTLKLPHSVPPGITTSYIVIEEQLPNQDPNVISSRVLLKHRISIQGEYPDKFVDVDVNLQENKNDFKFMADVENKGKKDIGSIKTTFFVNDKEQEQRTIETEETSLGSQESTVLSANIEKSYFTTGEYTVSAITIYDDLEVEVIKELRIGKPEVEVSYFTEYFLAHAVSPYTLDLHNKWNKEIKNVFVDVIIKKDAQKIDEFRTKSVDIDGLMTERINDYLDGRNKDPGIYSFDMIVNFWNNFNMETKTFQAEILPEGSSLAGKAGSTVVNNSIFQDKQSNSNGLSLCTII